MKSRANAKLENNEWILELKDGTVLFEGEGIDSVTDLMDRLQDEMSRRGWSEIQFAEDQGDLIKLSIISEDLHV